MITFASDLSKGLFKLSVLRLFRVEVGAVIVLIAFVLWRRNLLKISSIMKTENKELIFKIIKAVLMVLASYFGGTAVASCCRACGV